MGGTVDIKDIFPPPGHVQRLRCSDCDGWLDLAYADFDEAAEHVGKRVGPTIASASLIDKDAIRLEAPRKRA